MFTKKSKKVNELYIYTVFKSRSKGKLITRKFNWYALSPIVKMKTRM